MAAHEKAELEKKQADAAKKAKEKEELEKMNAEKDAALAAAGKRAAGGLHKFDPDEVDVHGGAATADDFMDAFGFGDGDMPAEDAGEEVAPLARSLSEELIGSAVAAAPLVDVPPELPGALSKALVEAAVEAAAPVDVPPGAVPDLLAEDTLAIISPDDLARLAACYEAELKRASAALEAKVARRVSSTVFTPPSDSTITATIEGVAIDCVAIAAGVIAHAEALPETEEELQRLIAATEGELGKAQAALERKRQQARAVRLP